MGLRPGVPDLTFEAERFVGHIELKAPGNTLSPAQILFRDDCRRFSIPFIVCTSTPQVHDQLVLWGFLPAGRFTFQGKNCA